MPHKNLLSLHEAIVIALINHKSRGASFEAIANYIEERDLYQERKISTSFAAAIKEFTTKENGDYEGLFEQLSAEYIMLRDTEYHRPMLISNALDSILNHDYYFYHPFSVSLRVYDESFEIRREKKFSPEKIICIITKELPRKNKSVSSGRKKFIYYAEPDFKGKEEINVYLINESMERLKDKLDKPSFYLANVSDNAVINVGYFKLSKRKEMICTLKHPLLTKIKPIHFSESKKAKLYIQNLERIQELYTMRIFLQKKILDYKNQVRSDPSI